MAHLVEVAFKGNRKEFFVWNGEEPPAVNSHVVVEADRGEDVGRVHAVGEMAALRARGCTHGIGSAEPNQKALRVASGGDVRKLSEVREQDDSTRREASALVTTHALPMKLSDTEWRWDRRKLTLYFTADRRVDFRALVRDLAAKFRTRIELKQIGVRDEAKRLDGIGRCGKQYCSASWLPDLRPVNLGLAKDQKLSLNPTQISGACGRLMCCLRYEHDWYVETRRRFPKEGKSVTTAAGEERVVANDLFRERVTLRRISDSELRVIPLAQLNKELRGEPIETDAETDVAPADEWSDEILAMTDTVERPIPRIMRAPAPAERPVSIERAPRPQPQPQQQSRERPQRERPTQERPTRERPRDKGRTDTRAPSTPTQSSPPQTAAQQPAPQRSADRATESTAAPAERDDSVQSSQDASRDGGRRSRRRRGRRGGRRGGPSGPSGDTGASGGSGSNPPATPGGPS